MALNANNVRSALTGAVYAAPLGTPLPTSPLTSWNAAFLDLGYISEDGVTESRSDDWNVIRAWQNRTIVRQLLTGSDSTWAFTLLETTNTGLELYHGGSQGIGPVGGVYTLPVVEPTEDHRAFGIDVVDGTEHIRITIADAQVTEVGEIVYKNGVAVGYPITITARSDANGLVATKLSTNAAWASA